jgi:indolepyruvate ferredoxin oxidoreductase
VVSHLHVARGDGDVTTATVADGGAGLYLSGDILQAASATHLKKVDPGRTWAVVDSAFVPTAGMLQGTGSADQSRLAATLTEAVGADRTLLVDSTGLAERAFGTHLPANVVLLGAAYQVGALPLPIDALRAAIAESPSADMNLAAFDWGRWVAADPAAAEAALGSRGGGAAGPGGGQSALWDPTERAVAQARALIAGRELPAMLGPLVERRAGQLVDYQGTALAERWLSLVAAAAAADDEGHGFALTEAVAEGWFKLLTYKDEYEVARLHLRLDLDGTAADLGLGDAYRVRYHLHPPTLRHLGLDHKVALGRWGRPVFRGLAAMRRLRGTPLDAFGHARHRREERALAEEYASLMEAAVAGLTPATYDDAVALARSVATIRGYEDIKSAAIARWRTDTAGLRASVGAR